MNTLEKWIAEIRAGGPEGQHRAALGIAFMLTLVVAYFLVMYWYTKFLGVTNSVNNQPVVEEKSFLENFQEKAIYIFKNEQVVQ